MGSDWCQGRGRMGSLLRGSITGLGPLIRGEEEILGGPEPGGVWLCVQGESTGAAPLHGGAYCEEK